MKIIYYHRKGGESAVSIQETFRPLINEMEKMYDVEVLNVPYASSNPVKLIKNIIYIRKHSTKDGINHITGEIHYGVLGLIGRKSVLTIHDDYAIRQARRGVLDKLYKYVFWIFLPIKLVKAPICTNLFVLNNIKKLYNSNKLMAITHQTIPSIFSDKRKPFNYKKPVLLQIGTANNKNLETTLLAIQNMNCKLVVLKQMSEKQHQMAKSLGIDYENKFGLPFEDVVEEYNRCDIVVFPSLFEGMGVPIIEGQAAGKPVITTDREPMSWVAGGAAVLLKNPLDITEYREAIVKIIQNELFREKLIEKGKENINRFSLKNAVDSYKKLYESL